MSTTSITEKFKHEEVTHEEYSRTKAQKRSTENCAPKRHNVYNNRLKLHSRAIEHTLKIRTCQNS